MSVTEIGDPRLQALFGASDPREASAKPLVRLPRKGLSPAMFGLVLAAGALLLFVTLNARRTTMSQPPVSARADSSTGAWSAPPPLYMPPDLPDASRPDFDESGAPLPSVLQPTPSRPAAALATAPLRKPEIAYPVPVPQTYIPPQLPSTAELPRERVSSGAPLVIDAGSQGAGVPAPVGSGSADHNQSAGRIRASTLANRSTTVVQGTIIEAVLETGFDSNTPGHARAVVSRDVRSFDGRNVLIPRGSKLIGDYKSDVAQGQKRAVIMWSRLIRPDGMTIALDSPAVDTLGRGGVAAKVNSHFLARLGDALLQTTIEIGASLAQRRISAPVVVLPQGAAAVAAQGTAPKAHTPTLTVAPGKSVSVFVAHDLDFSAGGASQ